MEETQSYYDVLSIQPGEELGRGSEAIVKELGEDLVIKEVNPYRRDGEKKSLGEIEHSRSDERIQTLKQEQKIMAEIFGDNYLPIQVVQTIHEGNKTFLFIQERLHGDTLQNMFEADIYKSEEELVERNREQFAKIIWGTKKAFIEFGTPLDMHIDNIMRDDKTETLKLADFGRPIENNELITGNHEPVEPAKPPLSTNQSESKIYQKE